jgi:hypothetical protein
MSSLKTTNSLLAVIAACLLFIAGRGIVESAVPSANAQPSNRMMVYGCFKQYSHSDCDPKPIGVTVEGYVINMPKH